jgi:hypothetical protein
MKALPFPAEPFVDRASCGEMQGPQFVREALCPDTLLTAVL